MVKCTNMEMNMRCPGGWEGVGILSIMDRTGKPLPPFSDYMKGSGKLSFGQKRIIQNISNNLN